MYFHPVETGGADGGNTGKKPRQAEPEIGSFNLEERRQIRCCSRPQCDLIQA